MPVMMTASRSNRLISLWRRHERRLVAGLLFWLALWLSGCAVAAVELPTPAALAALPAAGEPGWLPPPTWTPPAVEGGRQIAAAGPLTAYGPRPTRTPRPTPDLPTRTPIPPTPTPGPTRPATTPTATSYRPAVYDLAHEAGSGELGPSKLGLHVIRNNDPAIMAFVRDAQPALIKAVDDVGFLEEVKQASPRTITIGRLGADNQVYAGEPENAARDFVASQLTRYLANPYVDYWEGWNEPDPNMEYMGWYARFEAERVRLLAQHGLRAAVGGFATGVPEFEEFQLFLPAIEAARAHGGILSLHEYGAPDLTYLYGSPLPGMPAYPDRGALTFRYRWFYRDILEPADLVVPLAITEAGVDGIIGNRPGPNGLGWWDFGDYWVEQGWGSGPAEAFINQLAWYDAGVRQDGYVIGFAVFTAGGFDHWLKYDINPLLPAFAGYVRGQR